MSGITTFTWVKRIKLVNRWLQGILATAFIVGLNFLASEAYWRSDLTMNARYSLSPESAALVKALATPVEVIVTLTEQADENIYNDVRRMLDEYAQTSQAEGDGSLSVEYVDIYRQRARAQELVSLHGLDSENAILFVSGERRRRIDHSKLYEVNEEGEITGFNGEEVFTAALSEVSRETQPKLYFLVGHGEMSLDQIDPARGLSRLKQYLLERGFELVALDISTVSSIPGDADAVVSVGAQAPISGRAAEVLRAYLEDQGCLIVFLTPYLTHGFDGLFYDWGVLADDRIIVERNPQAKISGGDSLIRRFSPDHPISSFLIEYQLSILTGSTRPVRPHPGAPMDDSLSVQAIMASSDQSWGERSTQATDPEFDPRVDLAGPVPLACIAERVVGSDLGLSLTGGRLAVFGNADMLANGRLDAYGNRVLMSNVFNWAVERNELLSIPPRPIQEYKLVIADPDLSSLLLWFMIVPGTVGLFGVSILSLRRF